MPQTPDSPEIYVQNRLKAEVREALEQGRLDDAEAIVSMAPESGIATPDRFILGGEIAWKRGEFDRALALLTEANLIQGSWESAGLLAAVYRESGDLEKAAEWGLKQIALRPDSARSHFEFGLTWLAGQRPERAFVAFKRATEIQADFAAGHEELGKLYLRLGNAGEASKELQIAANLAPSVEVLLLLAQCFFQMQSFERSETAARLAIELDADSGAALLALSIALFGQRRTQEAEVHLAAAIARDVTGSEAFQLALAMRQSGRIKEANANLRRAIRFDPKQIAPYALLFHNSTVTEEDRPLLETMLSMVEDRSILPSERASLHYGVGKGLEDLGEYEAAMAHYNEANRITSDIKSRAMPMDRVGFSKSVDTLIHETPESRVAMNALSTNASELPIFIFGMTRSGTTLVEQILSCHREIEACGELPFWASHWRRAFARRGTGPSQEGLISLAGDYLYALQSLWPNAKRITDKTPGNGMFAGIVHLALPKARMIHLRRSPIDNALSIWKTPNVGLSEGANEKSGIVFVFKEYMRLMEHWRRVLPPDRFLEVDYEELVADPEHCSRELVVFCGLDWDDACLHPDENERIVSTPSAWQVRQSVYKTSVDKWRHFEPWLGELSELVKLRHPEKRQRP